MLLNTCLASMTSMLLSLQTRPLQILFCVYFTLNRLLIKGIMYWQFTCQPKYIPTTPTKKEIPDTYRSVLCSFGISTKDEEPNLSSLYWIPKLHKCPYKPRYVAGFAKCFTKPLSIWLTSTSDQTLALELLWHLLREWCESDVDYTF